MSDVTTSSTTESKEVKTDPWAVRQTGGDLLLTMSEGGIDSTEDGETDESFQTAIILSLFGPSDWWGNAYATDAESLSSRFGPLMESGAALTNATRLAAEDAARADLAWLKTVGAESVAVSATIQGVETLVLDVDILGPRGEILALKFGINWLATEVRLINARGN